MDLRASQRVALMAIHPEFAEAILAGSKKAEFRKRRLAPGVTTVWIYSTAPQQRVVGKFEIGRTVSDSPKRIWRDFGDVGSITKEAFFRYYGDSPVAVAFEIVQTERVEVPFALSAFDPPPSIPQSFVYLDVET